MRKHNLIAWMALVVILLGVTPTNVTAAVGDTTGAGLFGAAPNTISVDLFSGGASGAYGFVVPPGRSGLQPSVQVTYNSTSSESGPVGRGWNLTLPYIQRDTRAGQPSFTWSDTFSIVWSGRPLTLIVTCDPSTGCPAGIREFRTEVETFLRIKSYSIGASPTYWEVEDGDGRKYQFGRDDGTGAWTQMGDFKWGLNRIDDVYGNYLTVEWLFDYELGVVNYIYPKTIRYTGSTITGLSPTNRVDFGYEGRYDEKDSYLGVKSGMSKTKIRYRLRLIRSWAGSQVASVYLLDYSTASTGSHPIDLCNGVQPPEIRPSNKR